MNDNTNREVFRRLLNAYGPQSWWPGDSPWEVMVGAVLVQNTSWKNVERAINNLRGADRLRFERMRSLGDGELRRLIRPAGFFRIKTARLRSLVRFVEERFAGSVERMHGAETEELRTLLLGVHGIGPETADSILCYALERPVMVADAFARRIFSRHGWVSAGVGYEPLRRRLAAGLPREASVCNEMHALVVKLAHTHCRRSPLCEGCPLEDMLPGDGPLI